MPSPMTRWSRILMPRRSPASLRRAVMLLSSADGAGSPLGWLWRRMTAAFADDLELVHAYPRLTVREADSSPESSSKRSPGEARV